MDQTKSPYNLVGHGKTRQVFIERGGKEKYEITPEKSLRHINHSPDGFAWGYAGSGPAQLAFAILLELTTFEFAENYYQEFKHEIVAPLPQNFILPMVVILNWIQKKEKNGRL